MVSVKIQVFDYSFEDKAVVKIGMRIVFILDSELATDSLVSDIANCLSICCSFFFKNIFKTIKKKIVYFPDNLAVKG